MAQEGTFERRERLKEAGLWEGDRGFKNRKAGLIKKGHTKRDAQAIAKAEFSTGMIPPVFEPIPRSEVREMLDSRRVDPVAPLAADSSPLGIAPAPPIPVGPPTEKKKPGVSYQARILAGHSPDYGKLKKVGREAEAAADKPVTGLEIVNWVWAHLLDDPKHVPTGGVPCDRAVVLLEWAQSERATYTDFMKAVVPRLFPTRIQAEVDLGFMDDGQSNEQLHRAWESIGSEPTAADPQHRGAVLSPGTQATG